MAIEKAGYKRTQSRTALYIESTLRSKSTPDLEIGFKIVFRLAFIRLSGISVDPISLSRQGIESATRVFGLDDKHYQIHEPGFSTPDQLTSVFWEVYWDDNYLDLRTIRRFERELNYIAKSNQIVIKQLGTTIMARELAYLHTMDM